MKGFLFLIFTFIYLFSSGQDNSTGSKPGAEEILQYMAGDSLMQAGDYAGARMYFQKVIALQNKSDQVELKSDAMAGLGKAYEYTGHHDSAFFWYMQAYTIIAGSSDTLRRARGLRDMAQLLRVLRQLDKARSYCRMALDLAPGIRDKKILANIYNETAYLFELADELDSAKFYYNKLIEISVKNGYLEGESVGYSNLASVYEREGQYEEALKLKQKGLEIDMRSDDIYGMMNSYRSIGSTYLALSRFRDALNYLDKASAHCDTSWIMDLSGIEHGYYQVYKGMGNFAEALLHFEKYTRLSERINQEESKKQVNELLTRYETVAKEQKIQMLEQGILLSEQKIKSQRLLISALILIGCVLFIISWWWIRNKNQALGRMKTELHHFLLSQEMEKEQGNPGCNHQDHQDHTNPEDPQGQENAPESSSVHPHENDPPSIYLKWGLTHRESEVLYYLGEGCTNAHIASQLYVSQNTVKFHIKNIYLKLDVKNRIQALLLCNGEDHHLPVKSNRHESTSGKGESPLT